MVAGGGLERPEAPSSIHCKRLVIVIQAAELKYFVFHPTNEVPPTVNNAT